MIGSSNFGEITVDNLSTCKTWNNEPVVFPFQYIKSLYKLGILKATVSKLHSIFIGVDCKVIMRREGIPKKDIEKCTRWGGGGN